LQQQQQQQQQAVVAAMGRCGGMLAACTTILYVLMLHHAVSAGDVDDDLTTACLRLSSSGKTDEPIEMLFGGSRLVKIKGTAMHTGATWRIRLNQHGLSTTLLGQKHWLDPEISVVSIPKFWSPSVSTVWSRTQTPCPSQLNLPHGTNN